ncbi:sonic hedgehog protein A [Bombus pyrosoma]|uniref:sonic hedgehog protein A n=1 Tax=Bombus pyrosoma TaxID=396416 RepID=UPI001CB8DB34|nr:sonic hedgehog protein A [Bombus pyrosoma]XP_043600570.1 sonic hedgehog protein A [Bombus pyrosoma]XP_043600571.1 sonic hedgehog protein A [Bombus pyrosoma]
MVHHHHRRRGLQASNHCTIRRRGTTPSLLQVFLLILCLWLPLLDNGGLVLACGPGRGGGRRPGLRKLTPLVFKQHVPNVSENTLPASGISEGRVSRHDSRFRDLVPNYNADIIFKDEEGTGADRLMTQRCKEKLNTLAISVMNQWPGVKLRVTEGWDEEGKHATDSLHYEGRAVDVTTSDRDRSKYGMLARLAVEAGFDWVYYESRSHIHCSVKSESSSAAKSGGCFPGRSLVRTADGSSKRLDQVRLGERIAALDSHGDIVYSEVIAFLDRSFAERRQFVRLTTESGRVLTLTPAHLVPIEGRSTVFAGRVQPGDKILVRDPADENEVQHRLRWDKVIDNRLVLEEGIYAPLTTEGTVLVDDVVASCYAFVDNQELAHFAFLPYRMWSAVRTFFERRLLQAEDLRYTDVRQDSRTGQEGILGYASFLYWISSYVTPSRILYQ